MGKNMNSLDSLYFTLQGGLHFYLHDPIVCWAMGIVVGFDDKTMKLVQAKHAWSDHSVVLLRSLREDFITRRGESI